MSKRGKKYPPRSAEHLKNLSIANSVPRPWTVGIKRSEETKRKMSKSQIGNQHFLGKKHTEESRIKLSESKKGEKNPNWRGGVTEITEKSRKTVEYKIWRESVFKRDEYTCQFCSKKGGELHADHIKPYALYVELRFDVSNGRTLCIDCHKKTETYGGNTRIIK